MTSTRRLALACAVSGLVIGGATFAQAAPGAGIGQAAPSILTNDGSQGAAPLVQKAWWHRHWGWHHHWWHHHWHHW